jgi:DNA-binding response OmpR family regulator
MRILVIEDDRKMACILQEALEKQLHRVVLTFTGPDGLDVARSHQFEAIILDAMLPAWMDFWSLDPCASRGSSPQL